MENKKRHSSRHILLGIIFVSFLSTLGVLFCVFTARATNTVPGTMNFQGRLTDGSGNIVGNGSYNLKFAIYK